MLQESQDLIAEAEELSAFLETLDTSDWERETGFMTWAPWDVVAHLHYFDEVSLLCAEGLEAFAPAREELIRRLGEGQTNKQIAREKYGELAPEALRERWLATCREMAQRIGELDPGKRLPWFGPPMGVRMFVTARYMETWAHGQEIYDLKKARRTYTDRIKNVATIGVKTFGWTFVNRKREVPGPPPYVRLVAPSGEIWEWGEPSESDYVRGDAIDFCHVVTQGRNVADTPLEVVGDVANQWMAIAQCFAGGPVDPPTPGTRTGA
ncbi:MAG: TIGR03084 family metal-binding protein [Myxococcota bacterium]